MTGDRSHSIELLEFDGGSVTFGDGSNARIVGKGTISILDLPLIEDVLFVEGLKHNLLSIFQICDKNIQWVSVVKIVKFWINLEN